MEENRKGSHSVYELHAHIFWSTKYRYGVLRGDIQLRCRDLIRQVCDSMDIAGSGEQGSYTPSFELST